MRSGVARSAGTLLAATVGGLAGHATGLPGGALVGAMIGAGLVAHRRPVDLPPAVGITARGLIGAVAGSMATAEVLSDLGPLALWGTVASLLLIAGGIGLGAWAARWTGLDRGSGVMAVVPGGLSELSGLASELELRTDVVVAVHLVRRVGVVLVAVAILAVAPGAGP